MCVLSYSAIITKPALRQRHLGTTDMDEIPFRSIGDRSALYPGSPAVAEDLAGETGTAVRIVTDLGGSCKL